MKTRSPKRRASKNGSQLSSNVCDEDSSDQLTFQQMGIDDRLLKSIRKLGWKTPTLVQQKVIPSVLAGKDVSAKACTGTGKTGAFVIPTMQRILLQKQASRSTQAMTKVLVLVPTKELSKQTYEIFVEMAGNCSREVRCMNLTAHEDLETIRTLLLGKPDVVISTPSRVLLHMNNGSLDLKDSLEILIIDEYDLVVACGFQKDAEDILSNLPPAYQIILTSATVSEYSVPLKGLFMHNPVTVELSQTNLPTTKQLTQYYVECLNEDKFVLLCMLLKLRIIVGRTLIFVSSVDQCYQLKLFLEPFGINVCILNSELPAASRCRILEEFNNGLYHIMVTSDEDNTTKLDSLSKRKRDKESGGARGIDFWRVTNVINFNFPRKFNTYIHRVGRTARGSNRGIALSFVLPNEHKQLVTIEKRLRQQQGGKTVLMPYEVKMDEIESFRYRARDALHAASTRAVKEARLKDIELELVNSKKLKTFFRQHPDELKVLETKQSNGHSLNKHLTDVPQYIVPDILRNVVRTHAPPRESQKRQRTNSRGGTEKSSLQKNKKKKSVDVLRSFSFPGIKKTNK